MVASAASKEMRGLAAHARAGNGVIGKDNHCVDHKLYVFPFACCIGLGR